MFSKLLHLNQFVDQTMAMLFQKFPDEVMCHKGCSDCCNAVFDLSLVEACYLVTLFQKEDETTRREVLERSKLAQEQWQEFFTSGSDPSQGRIRCPLLADTGVCACYRARPINCRTYGVPTVINGTGHVCGLSKFDKGKSYPTLDLTPLQKSIYEYSVQLGGKELGNKRWSVAAVVLNPEQFAAVI